MNTEDIAELDYLAGLLELTTDDPDRARKAATLVPREAILSPVCVSVLDLVRETLDEVENPTMSDLVGNKHYYACRELFVDLIMKSRGCRFGYSLGVDRYAWHIRADWKRRLVALAAEDLQSALRDGASSAADIMAATRAVEEAASNVENADRMDTLLDAIDEWLRLDATPVVPTGFAPIDTLCGGGLPIGGLFVIAAPPSVGKSALALQIVLGALEHDRGLNAVWCMGEMRKDALARRAICHWSTRGTMHPVSMSAADQRTDLARGAAANMAAAIGDRLTLVKPPLTIQKIEQAVIEKKAKIVVIDYVQLVEFDGAQDRRAEIDGIVKRVRRLSLEHGVATVCVSNIAKVVSGETRIGAIGKESSELDFAADILLLGVADETENEHGHRGVRWACKKNRHGPCEDVEAIFDGRLQTFTAAQASRDAAFDGWGA
jgi:replicative DNA helicase